MTKPFIIAFAIHTAVVTSVGVSGAHAQAVNLTPEQIDMVRDCRAQGHPTRACIEQAQSHNFYVVMQRLRAVQSDGDIVLGSGPRPATAPAPTPAPTPDTTPPDRWLNIVGHIPGYSGTTHAKLNLGSVVPMADGSVMFVLKMDDGQLHFLTADCRGHSSSELDRTMMADAVGSLADVAAHAVCH